MFYVCTLQVSAPGGSEYLGVHQQHSGLCEPVSNLTRRVSNKTFWIAISPRNFRLHFRKVMARETLSLFKSFEELPTHRGPNLSHFGFFSSISNLKFRIGIGSHLNARWILARRFSVFGLFLIHLPSHFLRPISARLIFSSQMVAIKSSAS
jgi:hypothetical protein